MASEYISIKDLAAELGMDRSHLLKLVKKLNVTSHKMRLPDTHGNLSFVLGSNDAEIVRRYRADMGFSVREGDDISTINLHGFFYIIQLVPELDPKRVKLGFAVHIGDRLSQHQTSAPTATLYDQWPCRRTWELTAMACITRKECRLIASETFECDDLDRLSQRAKEFFDIMPNPECVPDLAPCSPLKR